MDTWSVSLCVPLLSFEVAPGEDIEEDILRETIAESLEVDANYTMDYFEYLAAEKSRLSANLSKSAEALLTFQKKSQSDDRIISELKSRTRAMQLELNEYKQRLDSFSDALTSSSSSALPSSSFSSFSSSSQQGNDRIRSDRLEKSNSVLQKEVDDLRKRLVKTDVFKREVLRTIEELREQIVQLTQHVMLGDFQYSSKDRMSPLGIEDSPQSAHNESVAASGPSFAAVPVSSSSASVSSSSSSPFIPSLPLSRTSSASSVSSEPQLQRQSGLLPGRGSIPKLNFNLGGQ